MPGAPNRALMLLVGLAVVLGCDSGSHSPAVKDAGGTEGGMDILDAGDSGLDGSIPGDGSMPGTCSGGVPLEGVCSGYCSNLNTACAGANRQFVDDAACIDACVAPTWSCGTPTETTGNTLFCRVSHAMAARSSPDVECPLAGPNSASCI